MSENARLDLLEKEIARLTAKDEIRECIYRVYRGIDRIDEAVLRSAFHDDAVVDFRPTYQGPFGPWAEMALKHQRTQAQSQHMVGHSIIQIDGDNAVAESYALARHKNNVNGTPADQIISMRLLDRLSRRDGVWKISERKQVLDWARIFPIGEGNDLIYEKGILEKGTRDPSDASYRFLR